MRYFTLLVLLLVAVEGLVNICDDSVSPNGPLYHFTYCSQLSLVLPCFNVAVVVEDSTVTDISMLLSNSPLVNVSLTFVRCAIRSALGYATSLPQVTNVTLIIDSCSITFDTLPLMRLGHAGVFLELNDVSSAKNVMINMTNTVLRLTGIQAKISSGDMGFVRVQLHRGALAGNLGFVLIGCDVMLQFGNLTQDGVLPLTDNIIPVLISVGLHYRRGTAYGASISNIALTIRNTSAQLEGPVRLSLLEVSGVVINGGSFSIAGTTLQVAMYGLTSPDPMERSGFMIDIQDAPCGKCNVTVVGSRLVAVSTAGSATQRSNSVVLKKVVSGIVTLQAPKSALLDSGDVELLPSTVVLQDCHVVSDNIGGQFSAFMGQIHSLLVEIDNNSARLDLHVRSSTVNATMRTDCPFRRMVPFSGTELTYPRADMSGLSLAFVVAHVTMNAPISELTLSMTGSSVIANFSSLNHCHLSGSSAILPRQGFSIPFSDQLVVATQVGGVVVNDATAVAKLLLWPLYGALTSQLAAFPSALSSIPFDDASVVSNVSDSYFAAYNVTLRQITMSSGSVTQRLNRSSSTQLGVFVACGGLWNTTSIIINGAVASSPIVSAARALFANHVVVSVGNIQLPPHMVPVVSSIVLTNVSCFSAACDVAMSLSNVLSPIAVTNELIGDSLIALRDGSEGLLMAVAWRFSHIYVEARNLRWFSVFGISEHLSDTSLIDVSLNCVLWNGQPRVPMFSDPLLAPRLSVVPTSECTVGTVNFSQTLVDPLPTSGLGDGADAAGAAAFFLSSISVVASFVGVVGTSTGAAEMQVFSLLGLSLCSPQGAAPSRGPTAYLLSPFADLGDGWATGGNILLSLTAILIHVFVLWVTQWRAGRTFGTQRRKEIIRRWEAAAAKCHFPNASLSACLLLSGGANSFGMRLLKNNASAGSIVVGLFGVLWAAVVHCAAVGIVIVRHPLPLDGTRLRFESYTSFDIMCVGKPAVLRTLLPLGFWAPPHERSRLGRLIGGVRLEWVRWGVAPQAITTTVVALVTVVLPTGDGAQCTAQWSVLALVTSAVAAFHVMCRPARVSSASITTAVMYGVMSVVCVVAALVSSDAVGHAGSSAIEGLSILLATLNVARVVHSVTLMVLERRVVASTSLPSVPPHPLLQANALRSSLPGTQSVRLPPIVKSRWCTPNNGVSTDSLAALAELIVCICTQQTQALD